MKAIARVVRNSRNKVCEFSAKIESRGEDKGVLYFITNDDAAKFDLIDDESIIVEFDPRLNFAHPVLLE